MRLKERIKALDSLNAELQSDSTWLKQAVESAYLENKWFTPANSWKAIESIRDHFLNESILSDWAAMYGIDDNVQSKVIGLVLAGNIPLVGFHDVLACFISGKKALIKCSSKDSILMRAVIGKLVELNPESAPYFEFTAQLKGFDAVIATGSNNSSRYFEQYFGKYPNIIRKNRNAVAMLEGSESEDDFMLLGEDIFNYFGLGCRNVSKLYVPQGYNFDALLSILHEGYKEVANHNKYRNNFDYNNALFLLNKVEFLMSGSLILTASKDITSRIATLHYEHYFSKDELIGNVLAVKDQIQCAVSNMTIPGIKTFQFGQAQKPGITDYADGVDTMAFLKAL